MPRTLPGRLTTETALAVTHPFFLVKIEWSPASYLSTGGTVVYDSQTWQGSIATLESLRALPGGALEGSISLTNTDDAMGAKVLGDDMSQTPVTVWALYGAAPYSSGDALQIFAGVLDGADISATRVVVGCVSEGRRRLTGPRLYCQPPTFNHLPPPGTVMRWNGETYILNADAPYMSPYAQPSFIGRARQKAYISPALREIAREGGGVATITGPLNLPAWKSNHRPNPWAVLAHQMASYQRIQTRRYYRDLGIRWEP